MSETKPTLSTETTGTEITRFNALRHGVLSRYTVLPWEDADEYHALVAALVAEHAPQGPTEEHLVEELAGILWRKRRLRLAEASEIQRGLSKTTDVFSRTAESALVLSASGQRKIDVADALRADPGELATELKAIDVDRKMTLKAIALLNGGRPNSYVKALAALHESTREAWKDQLAWNSDDYEEGEEAYKADTPSFLRYLETQIMPWYDNRLAELKAQPIVRTQALGEAVNPDKLERLGRYEVHLDRKLERMLAMLLRLKDLRQGTVAG